MHIKEKKRPTLYRLSKWYVGISYSVLLWFNEGGVRDLEESYNGLSVSLSHPVVLYYDNIVVLRQTRWKASDNIRQLHDWIKLIHV